MLETRKEHPEWGNPFILVNHFSTQENNYFQEGFLFHNHSKFIERPGLMLIYTVVFFLISYESCSKESTWWAERFVSINKEAVYKMLCNCKLPQMKIHYTKMCPEENSYEPASIPASPSKHLICVKENLWWTLHLDSFQLRHKCNMGSLSCIVMTVSLEICKVRIQAHVMIFFLRIWLFLYREEWGRGKWPQQIVGEGVLKIFHF